MRNSKDCPHLSPAGGGARNGEAVRLPSPKSGRGWTLWFRCWLRLCCLLINKVSASKTSKTGTVPTECRRRETGLPRKLRSKNVAPDPANGGTGIRSDRLPHKAVYFHCLRVSPMAHGSLSKKRPPLTKIIEKILSILLILSKKLPRTAVPSCNGPRHALRRRHPQERAGPQNCPEPEQPKTCQRAAVLERRILFAEKGI